MARVAQRGRAVGLPKGAQDNDLADSSNDICPVCKSSRYLNPNMRFLVNPECYHKMCSSCVDRIFSHGPAQCPVAGCRRTLRKHRFRPQTFDDIRVEREVDIRRTVAAVMNKREEDFETLLDYNNYLEDVEEMTFNLINGVDVPQTEKKLNAYREQNNASIKANASLARDELAQLKARQAAEKEQARLKREAARREIEEERREREQDQKMIIERLAKGGEADAGDIVREGERVRLKRAGQRRQQQSDFAANIASSVATTNENDNNFVIRGLKKPSQKVPADVPYDPFAGLQYAREYFVLREQYDWDYVNKPRDDVAVSAGGYDANAYCERALCDGFAGLGVIIADEMTARNAEIVA